MMVREDGYVGRAKGKGIRDPLELRDVGVGMGKL